MLTGPDPKNKYLGGRESSSLFEIAAYICRETRLILAFFLSKETKTLGGRTHYDEISNILNHFSGFLT